MLTVLLSIVAASRDSGRVSTREIRVVLRDMTFYVDGSADPNPTLRVLAGEEVRLVLRNEDTGISHDFTVGEWKVATPLVEGRGEAEIVFRVPGTAGEYAYTCTPHARMMRGRLVVESRN